jgi:hypothetical protein
VKRPALLARFPKPFWWRPDPEGSWHGDVPVVPDEADDRYPDLAPDFRLWRQEFEARFQRFDHEAQLRQHEYWRQQVTLIVGGLLATVLGAFQAARGGANMYVGAAQAVVTGLLTGITALAAGRRAQQHYLTARLKAEQTKSEFFLYLARVGDYAESDRGERVRHRVEDIADAEEAG